MCTLKKATLIIFVIAIFIGTQNCFAKEEVLVSCVGSGTGPAGGTSFIRVSDFSTSSAGVPVPSTNQDECAPFLKKLEDMGFIISSESVVPYGAKPIFAFRLTK